MSWHLNDNMPGNVFNVHTDVSIDTKLFTCEMRTYDIKHFFRHTLYCACLACIGSPLIDFSLIDFSQHYLSIYLSIYLSPFNTFVSIIYLSLTLFFSLFLLNLFFYNSNTHFLAIYSLYHSLYYSISLSYHPPINTHSFP